MSSFDLSFIHRSKKVEGKKRILEFVRPQTFEVEGYYTWMYEVYCVPFFSFRPFPIDLILLIASGRPEHKILHELFVGVLISHLRVLPYLADVGEAGGKYVVSVL